MLSYGTDVVKDEVDKSRMGANIGGPSCKSKGIIAKLHMI